MTSMTPGAFLFILFTWCLLRNSTNVEGRISSKENDLELKSQLKLLNKPAIKTIKTTYGDVYNCVDFYQQPAFDHPLLKNATLHSQAYPKAMRLEDSSSVFGTSSIWLNGKGCPDGTVPIKKITKNDLLTTKMARASAINPQAGNLVTHFAGIRTKGDPNNKFHGAGMITSVYNPRVQDSQYSTGRMKIQNGADSIEVGWTVNPPLYKDHSTHFYINTNVGQTHCFDTLCPGFVLQNPRIPPGGVFARISTRGRPIYDENFYITKDPSNQNWVLQFGPNKTVIGYWPTKIMAGLTDFATYIDWGGEVSTPPDADLPEMGTGFTPHYENTDKDAFGRQITIVNEVGQAVTAVGTEAIHDINGYQVADEGDQGGVFQHLFFFGGPNQDV